jgi:hypothetical protein
MFICLFLSFFVGLISLPIVGMLRSQSHAPIAHQASPRPISSPVHHAVGRNPVRFYNTKKERDDHEAKSYAKRQETWARIKNCATERARELSAQGAKHRETELKLRAQMAHHIRSVKIYETLAELEIEKFRLFELTINKLNESANSFEEPNFDTETKLLQLLHETYEEFYDGLPEEEKLHLEDKF